MISYNFISIWTLFKKEVYRFLKVGIQTVIGPAISSLLFLAIFTLALGRRNLYRLYKVTQEDIVAIFILPKIGRE